MVPQIFVREANQSDIPTMSSTTCESLIKKMKDENSDLYKAMNKAGAKYLSEGPGKRAFIIKEWNQGLN